MKNEVIATREGHLLAGGMAIEKVACMNARHRSISKAKLSTVHGTSGERKRCHSHVARGTLPERRILKEDITRINVLAIAASGESATSLARGSDIIAVNHRYANGALPGMAAAQLVNHRRRRDGEA